MLPPKNVRSTYCQKSNSALLAEVASYELAVPVVRKVDSEGFVQFQRSRYSVPPEHCGKIVSIQQKERRITIQCEQLIIAEHAMASRADSCVALPEHLQALWKQSVENSRAPLPSWPGFAPLALDWR
jgi:hypothetical protein